MALSSVSATVLIGGRSRRMGEPKALLRLADDGPTLIEGIAATLREIADDVTLVGRPVWPLPASLAAVPVVADRGESAADGIIAALAAARHRLCIVVGCDMPFLDGELVREMAAIAAREERGVVAVDADGRHPLHAVYDRNELPEIQAAVDGGERSLGALTRLMGMMTFDLAAPERTECQRWSVYNVNTQDDLAAARTHAARVR